MVRMPKSTRPPKILDRHPKNDGRVSYVLRYITPTILHFVNVCNPTAPTTAQLPGASFPVDARLTAGPPTRA